MSGDQHNQAGETRDLQQPFPHAPPPPCAHHLCQSAGVVVSGDQLNLDTGRVTIDGWTLCGRVGSTLHRGCHRRQDGGPWQDSPIDFQRRWADVVGDDGITTILLA